MKSKKRTILKSIAAGLAGMLAVSGVACTGGGADEKDRYGKEMPLRVDYFVESDVIVCKCSVESFEDALLQMFTSPHTGVARGSAAFVDFSTGEMGMYGGISTPQSPLTVKYSKTIDFTLKTGVEYVVEMSKKNKEHILKITDPQTSESDVLEVMPTGSNELGEHWGSRSYIAGQGVKVNEFKNYSLQPYECRLLIIGDSFVEGAATFAQHEQRYCIKMKEKLNGSCAISGFGGATTGQVKEFYEKYCTSLFKPDYVLIACGTNNTEYRRWLQDQQGLIAAIKANGSIPILVTITRRLDSDNLSFIQQANNWIRNESNELYIDINYVTTLNNDCVTQNEALFCADKVHPLASTHELIFQRALLDVPELFNV